MGFQQALDEGRVTRNQLTLLAICFALNMVDGYDVLSIAFAATPLTESWGLKADALGILMSSGVLGMTLGAMFLAPLTDSIGRRVMIIAAVLLMGLSMVLSAKATQIHELVVLRVMTGLGTGAMLASLTTLISEFFPSRHRNVAIGITLAGYPIGATLGGLLAARLIPEYGWQSVFLAGGIATLVLLPVVVFQLPESVQFLLRRRPRDFRQKATKIVEKLQLAFVLDTPGDLPNQERVAVTSLLGADYKKLTLLIWSGFFLTFGTLYFLLSWIPKLLVDSGMELSTAIYASASFNLAGALGNIGIGAFSNRFGLARGIVAFALFAAISMGALAISSAGDLMLLGIAAMIGFFQQGTLIGFYILSARAYPSDFRTTGIGWGIGLGRMGAVVAPYAGGLMVLNGVSMQTLFLLYATPTLAAGIIGHIACRLFLPAENQTSP